MLRLYSTLCMKKRNMLENLIADSQWILLIEDRWAKCFQMRADSLILLAAHVVAKKWGSSFTNGQQSLADATAQTAHSSSVRLLPPRSTYIVGLSFSFLFSSGVILLLASWRNQLLARRRLPASPTRDLFCSDFS